MTDGDDDLDLLEESTEALWDAKIVAMVSQSELSQKNELDEDGPSSYDEDDRQSIASQYNDKSASDSEENEFVESENLISPNRNQGNTNTTSNNVQTITQRQVKWSFDDLYDIGLGSKPDVVSTSGSGKVIPTKSGQTPQGDVSKSKPGGSVVLPDVVNIKQKQDITADKEGSQQLPDVSKGIVFNSDDDDEELDDYVDSDSDAERISSSPEKSFVTDSRLKRSFDYDDKDFSSLSQNSDDDFVSSSPLEFSSSSSDRPKITARRRFSSKRLFHTETVIISDDSSSPQKMFHKSPDTKNTKQPSVMEDGPPLKVTRFQNECARGDSNLSTERNFHSDRIGNHEREENDKKLKVSGIKCTISRKGVPRKDSKSTKELMKSGKGTDFPINSQERQSNGTVLSGPEKNQSSVAIAKQEDIDKVCELFPDACRTWIKQRIEAAIQSGNKLYLDYIVDSMVERNYPKSTSQNDPVPALQGDKEPDIVAALGSNKIQSAHRQIETDSGPAVRLYGKKANYTGGVKGKGKSVVPQKPVRNILDEYETSEDEGDISMDAAESMDTLRDNEVSSSSMTCESCKMNKNTDMVVQCCDGHLICNSCVEKEVKEILSPDSQETQIKCPSENCQSRVPESQAKKILPSLILELLEDKLHKQAVESINKMEDLVTCPNCSFPVVMDVGIKMFECPNCKNSSCRYCKRLWMMTSHDDCNQFTTFLQENLDSKDLESPSYWHPMPEEGDKDYIIVTLDEKCVEFQHIKSLFSLSMSSNKITAIRRIQNPRLWQKFCLARKHMVEDFGQNQINEKQLFHGTNTKAFDAICREGLDWRMCGENGTAFGQGTYFAKQASYSDRYSQTTSSGIPNIAPLPPGNSSAAFAQAFNLPSSFNSLANPFQPTHQQSAFSFSKFPNPPQQQHNVFKTTSHTFPYVPPSDGSSSNTGASFGCNVLNPTGNNATATFGNFGPGNHNPPYPVFSLGNIGQSNTNNLIFQGHSQGQIMPTNVSNPDVSSTTGKVVFTNVDETIGPNKKYMFVARALVGRCCLGNNRIRKPPIDPGDPKRRPFNSCVDNVLTPSIFVIFDCAQCYPEYIIEYSFR